MKKLLMVLTLLASFSHISYGQDDGHKKITLSELPANMIPSKERPNAPSLAYVEGHKKISVDDWTDPEVCGSCHTTQYQGWKGSMHSNSFKDPIFQAEWALAEKQLGGDIGNLCAGCHSPPGMLSKTIKFDPKLGKHGGFTAPKVAEQGVSCDVCHTIKGSSFQNSSVLEHGNGSYISAPGNVKRGPLKDSKSPFHETQYSEHHTKAAFCANCHNIFNPINQFPLERTYDEWKYSVYAQNDVQCQDCHMVPVETAIRVADELKPARQLKDHNLAGKAAIGAKTTRSLIHGHAFVGGNATITEALGRENARPHSLIAQKRLRSAAKVEVDLTHVANQGALHSLVVKVTNQRAGHDIPTSLTFIRELWIEVNVRDQNNKLIFESGAIDDHNEVDKNAVMFKAYAVDKNGDPAQYIWTVERFERRTTIPPKGHRFGRYAFNVPEGVSELRVRTKLNYRSFSQHFVDHLLGEGKLKVPLTVMSDTKSVYQMPDLNLKSSLNLSAEDVFEAESSRLLEEYFSPESAIQDHDTLTRACSVCHGADGVGTSEQYPNIGGQNELYLLNALIDYQKGARQSDKMQAMVKGLKAEQLKKLAKHYAKMVRPPKTKPKTIAK